MRLIRASLPGLKCLLMAAALLLAMHASLVHPIVHVDEAGELVHDGHDHDGEGATLLCDTLAALTACAAGGSAVAPTADAPAQGVCCDDLHVPRVAEAPPFFSHAPPTRS